jgi:hypothetical protein
LFVKDEGNTTQKHSSVQPNATEFCGFAKNNIYDLEVKKIKASNPVQRPLFTYYHLITLKIVNMPLVQEMYCKN